MTTAVITTRLTEATLAKLDDLCARSERSRAWVVAKAVEAYVEEEEAFSAFIAEGDACFERGDTLTQEQMEAWVAERFAAAQAA